MREYTRVAVIGGGIVGAYMLYHLTKLGWSDVVLVERKQLTAGSTWHAAGGFHSMNSDPNVARLQAYTISLYKEVEKISGRLLITKQPLTINWSGWKLIPMAPMPGAMNPSGSRTS